MSQIKEIVNSFFSSKTYILYRDDETAAWLVDVGDIEPIVSFLRERQLTARGLFITHGHFDHIYGLLSLLKLYPNCLVYTTEFGKLSVASEKLNLSRYHETPLSYEGDNVKVVRDGDEIELFKNEPKMQFYETPGHNPGCLTMAFGDVLFTGDAYIPGVGVNTQLPYADKEQAQQSLERITKLAEGRHILSGHYLYK